MLLERLNGRLIEKVIMRTGFADVHYLHSMLLSVFTALGKAQSWLGACCSLPQQCSNATGLASACILGL